MANESITDDIIRDFFKTNTLYIDNKIIIEKQSTKTKKIDKLLKNASKSGDGKGYPDFIIQYKENPNLIIVIESKANSKNHKSDTLDKYKMYAVDGVLLYSSFLSKEYDVLAIAVSGEDKEKIKVSHYLQLKNTKEAHPIFKEDKLLTLSDYENGYQTNEKKFNQDFQELLKYSKILNDKFHILKVKESERSLLISGTLIALTDKAFCSAYKLKNPKSLSKYLISTIEEKLTNVQNQHIENIISSYSFIKTHTILSIQENELKNIINEIDEKINNFIKTYKYFDILGQFYIEFLRYANNDKGLGIVLTPPHITELFSEIANINKDSVILDTCTGTGGFLISAMRQMIIDAGGDKEKELKIKSKQIIGVEIQHDIFSLVCSNMYIHGDGRSNLIKGDCFDKNIKEEVSKYKPNVGFLNPPYKSSKEDVEELEFILNNLEQLEKGSLCVSIVPMRCAIDGKKNGLMLKEKLLKNHTLEAVFSMPDELFHNSNVTVVTAIMVFRAKEKHLDNYKTYFGYWKDDGFIKIKNAGRTDFYNRWEPIKKLWLENYRNRDEVIGSSIKKSIKSKDEWCSEAYIKTDYSTLSHNHFIKNIKQYLTYLFNRSNNISLNIAPKNNNNIQLNTNKWKIFKYTYIFRIIKGKRLTKKDQSDGNYPYVSSSSLNNGIDNVIGNGYTDENCLTFACYGSIGEVFYQDEKVWVSDNANVFYLKDREFNPNIALFLVTLLKLEQFRFSYGMTGKKERLEGFDIKLPVNDINEPNWEFMEKYIQSLSYSSNL